MKVALIPGNEGPVVALESGGKWLNFSMAYQAYRLIAEGVAAAPLDSVVPVLESYTSDPDSLLSMLAFMEQHRLTETYRLPAPSQFLLPMRPGKVIALGRNYAAHAKEIGFEPPEEPIIFNKLASACIGDGEPIVVRESCGRVDYEAELAVVIGRQARFVAEEDARDYIGGYTIVNDVTARGIQQTDIERGLPWFRSKSMDTFCPMGPVVALPDDMPWPVEVDIELRVNGEIRQKGNTSSFVFSIPRVLSFITRYMTLEPGDVISTGTPQGIGPMAPGDVIEITIPPIGTLRNPVAPSGARVLNPGGK